MRATCYQEALADFILTSKFEEGLQRVDAADGDEITTNRYGEENAFDLNGRLIDLAVGVATPGQCKHRTFGNGTIVGTPGNNKIRGGRGADTLTGGLGDDQFVYNNLRDAHDVIADFTLYADTLNLMLLDLGITPANAVADGYVRVEDVTGGASLQIDTEIFEYSEVFITVSHFIPPMVTARPLNTNHSLKLLSCVSGEVCCITAFC